MRALIPEKFAGQLADAPPDVQRHSPGNLRTCCATSDIPACMPKKYDEARDLWQARLTKDWRFYFRIEGDTYLLETIIPHPK